MKQSGLRKFLFCGVVFSASVVLVAQGIIPPTAFESITWAVLIAFAGGNVGEHLSKR